MGISSGRAEDADTPPAVLLSSLKDGDQGRFDTADLRCEDCDMLNALGMVEQCRLRVCKSGSPCIVQVGGTRIGLASSVADHITVIPVDFD